MLDPQKCLNCEEYEAFDNVADCNFLGRQIDFRDQKLTCPKQKKETKMEAIEMQSSPAAAKSEEVTKQAQPQPQVQTTTKPQVSIGVPLIAIEDILKVLRTYGVKKFSLPGSLEVEF